MALEQVDKILTAVIDLVKIAFGAMLTWLIAALTSRRNERRSVARADGRSVLSDGLEGVKNRAENLCKNNAHFERMGRDRFTRLWSPVPSFGAST